MSGAERFRCTACNYPTFSTRYVEAIADARLVRRWFPEWTRDRSKAAHIIATCLNCWKAHDLAPGIRVLTPLTETLAERAAR